MKIWIIVRKEWEEVFRNRLVLASVALTPLLFVGLSAGSFGVLAAASGPAERAKMEREADELREIAGAMCEGLSAASCLEVYMGSVFLLLFLMLPIILSNVFAAHSIVGEKAARTLEPLLATPITTVELLAAKALAAAIPSVIATWAAAAASAALSAGSVTPEARAALLQPHWLAAALIVGPLLAILGVLSALLVSSRVGDPRAAQQLAGLVVLPLVLLLTAQSVGLLMVDARLVAVGGAVLLALDAALLALAARVFDRESILTRWK